MEKKVKKDLWLKIILRYSNQNLYLSRWGQEKSHYIVWHPYDHTENSKDNQFTFQTFVKNSLCRA